MTTLAHAMSIPADDRLADSHLSVSGDALHDLFFLAPTAMVLSDPQEQRILVVNRLALELFGASSERKGDLRTSDFWTDEQVRQDFVALTMERGTVRGFRARLRRIDGTEFWARLSASLIEYNGQTCALVSISDVTEMVAAEEFLHRTQNTLRTMLEASPLPLVVTHLETGVVRYCNQRAADMFDTPVHGLVGHTAPEFYVDPSDRIEFVTQLREHGAVDGFVARLKTRHAQAFWAMLSAKTLELNGEPVFMVTFADVTHQKDKEAELETLAFNDPLTGAYNRRFFAEAAGHEQARSRRRQRSALALLDIDHFKRINDTLGHHRGDEVLREFVRVVQRLLRRSDVFARYGGEEFALLLPDTSLEDAVALLERIRCQVFAHAFAGMRQVSFSAGVVLLGNDRGYLESLQRADGLLYKAKQDGRNRVVGEFHERNSDQ